MSLDYRLYLGVRTSQLTSQLKCTKRSYNLMVLWFSGSLVLWFSGSLVLWFPGSLVLWFSGSPVLLVLRFSGSLVLLVLCFSWFSGSLVLWFSWFSWFSGSLVLWFSWFSGSPVLRFFGSLVLWFSWFSSSPGSLVLLVLLVLWFSVLPSPPVSPIFSRLARRKENMVVVVFFALLVAFVCTFSTCFAIKPDQPTKQFIQVVLENQNKEGSPISVGPFRAIPRGQHIRARLGVCAEAFLVPDVMLWDPLSYFPELFLFCPSCDEQGKREYLHPIRWKDGSTVYDQPRLLYGLRSDVLLAGRVYLCKNKHQILSHDPCILSQVRDEFQPPFVLFYRVGVTRELFQFFTSHIRVGMTIADVQVLWHQSLFDDYGLRKLCFLRESQQQSEFPSFSPKGKKTGKNSNSLLHTRLLCKGTLVQQKNVPDDCFLVECTPHL